MIMFGVFEIQTLAPIFQSHTPQSAIPIFTKYTEILAHKNI